jgi:intein/homing endonuclease
MRRRTEEEQREAARLAALTAKTEPYREFQEKYRDSAVDFVLDCIHFPKGKGPTDYQLELLDDLIRYQRISFRGPHGIGKCVCYNDGMRLADGSIVEAHELIGKSFDVLAVDKDLRVVTARAHAWDNGARDVVEITTDKGRVLTRTLNHPLWADTTPLRYSKPEYSMRLRPEGSWIAAGELTIGSAVAVYLGTETCEPLAMSDEAIKLAAYLIGDGNTTGGNLRITQVEGASLDEIRACCDALGAELRYIDRYDYRIVTKGIRGSGKYKNPVRDLVSAWGMRGVGAHDKCFPAWVWRLDNRQLAMFISRLFACDGWAHSGVGTSGKARNEIGLTTTSAMLARDTSRALLRLGVHAETRTKKTAWTHAGERRFGAAHTVAIHDAPNILRFTEHVGIFGKETQVDALAAQCRSRSVKEQQKWRGANLPTHLAWERVSSLRVIENQPTVAITVPGVETFLTEFVEHNTAFDAWVIHWFALTRDGEDWKLPTTASAWRQLTKFLWPEVHKWARSLRWDLIGRSPYSGRTELHTLSLRLATGEAFAVASNNVATIEGAHADALLYLFDESKTIPAETFDAAEGAFSGAGEDTPREAFAIANSTPGEPQGRFYDIQSRKPGYEDWHVRRVTKEEAIGAGRISSEWAEQRKRQWGEDSAVYQNRVEGEFASSDEDGVIPLAWVEAANDRWRQWEDAGKPGSDVLTCVGVDVSDSGTDRTVQAPRYGDSIDTLRYTAKEETMETAGRVAGLLNRHPKAYAVVDGIGIGAGVVSRLREMFKRERIHSFIASEHSDATDRTGELGFINMRAEVWWGMRERLDPTYGPTVALPPDDVLTGDLTAPHWKVASNGKIQIESKEQIAKRLERSTDAGDAVVQAFLVIRQPPSAVAISGNARPTAAFRQ